MPVVRPAPRYVLLVVLAAIAAFAAPLARADANLSSPPVNNADFDIGADAIKSREWDRAASHLEIAVRAEPANADAQNLLAYAYRQQKKLDLAFKHYREALRLDPKHRGAHEYIGEAYLMRGDKVKAQEHLVALERLCGKGCEEYQDLARAIAAAK
jgi:cytochrome c-type biogenesis protein CcmH/NrfG